MDRVVLRALQVEAAVGLLDWELAQTQVLSLDCDMHIDAKQVAATEELSLTVDYAELRDVIQHFCLRKRYKLLETLADQLSGHLLSTFDQATAVRLQVTKPAIFKDANCAGVEVFRAR